MFCDPASTREIASALTVSEDAVKKHLVRLYNEFRDLRRIRKPPRAVCPRCPRSSTGAIGLRPPSRSDAEVPRRLSDHDPIMPDAERASPQEPLRDAGRVGRRGGQGRVVPRPRSGYGQLGRGQGLGHHLRGRSPCLRNGGIAHRGDRVPPPPYRCSSTDSWKDAGAAPVTDWGGGGDPRADLGRRRVPGPPPVTRRRLPGAGGRRLGPSPFGRPTSGARRRETGVHDPRRLADQWCWSTSAAPILSTCREHRGSVAPELASGQPKSAASDVYAVAATAVTLITGTVPGDVPSARHRGCHDEHTP